MQYPMPRLGGGTTIAVKHSAPVATLSSTWYPLLHNTAIACHAFRLSYHAFQDDSQGRARRLTKSAVCAVNRGV